MFDPRLPLLAGLAALFVSLGAMAQETPEITTNVGADVWSVVEGQWNAEESGDKKWPERLLADDFSGWQKNSPAPRGKGSTIYWNRFNAGQGKTVAHELYPLSIVVNDDVAVVHYLYTSAFEDKDKEVEVSNGRFTDILVRTDDGWKFLAWHGGDDD